MYNVKTTDNVVQLAIHQINAAPVDSEKTLDDRVTSAILLGLEQAYGADGLCECILTKHPTEDGAPVVHDYQLKHNGNHLGNFAENFRWMATMKVEERYAGTKIVSAYPLPRNGKPGYGVIYRDDYVSWSPASEFEAAYRRIDDLTFGVALELLKKGTRVARAGWNVKGMWIALGGTPVTLEAEKFWNPHSKAHAIAMGGCAVVDPYFIMKTAQGSIQMGWVPSQADCLADDWCVLDYSVDDVAG